MKLPRGLTGDQITHALRRLGFQITRQVGSHVRLSKQERRVTVPLHRSVAPGTLQNILRQAGVSLEQFMDALH